MRKFLKELLVIWQTAGTDAELADALWWQLCWEYPWLTPVVDVCKVILVLACLVTLVALGLMI